MRTIIAVFVFVAAVTGCALSEPASSATFGALCTIEDQEAGLCGPFVPPPVNDVTSAPPAWSLPTTANVGLGDVAIQSRQELFDVVGNLSYGWAGGGHFSAGPQTSGHGSTTQCGNGDDSIGCSFRETYHEELPNGVKRHYDWSCWITTPTYSGYCTGTAGVSFDLVGGDLIISHINFVSGVCGRGVLRC